MTKQSTQPTTH